MIKRRFLWKVNTSNIIPNVIQKLVFVGVGFASKFLSSLVPCHRQWSLAPDEKFWAASLSKSQLLNHLRYSLVSGLMYYSIFCSQPHSGEMLQLKAIT